VPSVLLKLDVPGFQKEAAEKNILYPGKPLPGFGFHKEWSTTMHSLHFHTLARWFYEFESYGPAILVTIGAALLMACGIGATCSPCEEKDEVFHRQVF
jgi:hypothetical protein